MNKYLALALAGILCSATRPANCGTQWVKSGPGPREAKVRVTTWSTAPDVHRNISCRSAWSSARPIVAHGTFPQHGPGNWMYDRDGASGPGIWVQYYGGHGLSLRIRYLDERGYSPEDCC
jgi:hypothetical protein